MLRRRWFLALVATADLVVWVGYGVRYISGHDEPGRDSSLLVVASSVLNLVTLVLFAWVIATDATLRDKRAVWIIGLILVAPITALAYVVSQPEREQASTL